MERGPKPSRIGRIWIVLPLAAVMTVAVWTQGTRQAASQQAPEPFSRFLAPLAEKEVR